MQSEAKFDTLDKKRLKLVKMTVLGLKQVDIAAATGWTEGYISQLLGEAEVKLAIEQGKEVKSLKRVVVQDKYDNVEEKLLGALEQLIPVSEMRDVTRALETVAKCNPRSRGMMAKAIEGSGATVIAVELPKFMQRELNVQKNSRNEIIEIDGRDMTPVTPKQFHAHLPNLLKEVADGQ